MRVTCACVSASTSSSVRTSELSVCERTESLLKSFLTCIACRATSSACAMSRTGAQFSPMAVSLTPYFTGAALSPAICFTHSMMSASARLGQIAIRFASKPRRK